MYFVDSVVPVSVKGGVRLYLYEDNAEKVEVVAGSGDQLRGACHGPRDGTLVHAGDSIDREGEQY